MTKIFNKVLKKVIFLKYSFFLLVLIIFASIIPASAITFLYLGDETVVLKVTPGDNTPPSAVTDLQVIPSIIPGEISIKWTAPGNNNNSGRLGSGSRFHIATTIIPGDALDNNYWSGHGTTTLADIKISTSGVNPGDIQTIVLTGLSSNTTYFFRIWTRDSFESNWSPISIGATGWSMTYMSPANVTDLKADITSCIEGELRLTWSAPGEHGNSGTLVSGARFHIATTTVVDDALDDSYWNARGTTTLLADIQISTQGVNPGDVQTYIIARLKPSATYYIRMWTCNSNSLWSQISNGVTAWAQVDVTPPGEITDLVAQAINRQILLKWTSPGDDGSTGTLQVGSKFYIATTTILSDATNQAYWNSRSTTTAEIKISTSGVNPGDLQAYYTDNLRTNVTYYFHIWTSDEKDNWSHMDIGTIAYAQPIPPPQRINKLYADDTPQDDGTGINLYWSNGLESDIAGYRIYYTTYSMFSSTTDTGVIYYLGSPVNKPGISSFTVTGLTPNIIHYFAIVPVNKNEGFFTTNLTVIGPLTPIKNLVDTAQQEAVVKTADADNPEIKIIIPKEKNNGAYFSIIKVREPEDSLPGHSQISIINRANDTAKTNDNISKGSVETLLATQYEFTCDKPVEEYVTLTISYPSSIVEPEESGLRMYRLNETNEKWELAGKDDLQTIDKTRNTVTLRVNRLNIFRILVKSSVKNNLGEVKVYPNPFNSSNALHTKVKFMNLTEQSKIRIYTLTGVLVKELDVVATDLGYKEWNLTNNNTEDIASGLYVYVVTNDKGEKSIGQLGIIR